jgi:hypothetical protein
VAERELDDMNDFLAGHHDATKKRRPMMQRIHIVGPPRSGTTLMLELLVTGFRIDAYCPEEVSVLTLPPDPASVLCTKFPGETHLVAPLLDADPQQWFVFMLRDPRDVIVSRHGLAPDRYWANLWQWRRAWNEVRSRAQHERLIVVRYEALARAPDTVQSEIAARLPFLDSKAPFSEYHLHSRPSAQSLQALRSVRPVTVDSVGAWRRNKSRVAGQLLIHGAIAQELIELGYEPDDRWLEELEGVDPDLTPGFWPEQPSAEFAARRRRQLSEELPRYLSLRTSGPQGS